MLEMLMYTEIIITYIFFYLYIFIHRILYYNINIFNIFIVKY